MVLNYSTNNIIKFLKLLLKIAPGRFVCLIFIMLNNKEEWLT